MPAPSPSHQTEKSLKVPTTVTTNSNKNLPTGPSTATMLSNNALALMLAGLAMLGPFSVDTYLPAFPNIQASLHTDALQVQQTLTAYMLSFAVMMLWHGALSDSFGRRNI